MKWNPDHWAVEAAKELSPSLGNSAEGNKRFSVSLGRTQDRMQLCVENLLHKMLHWVSWVSPHCPGCGSLQWPRLLALGVMGVPPLPRLRVSAVAQALGPGCHGVAPKCPGCGSVQWLQLSALLGMEGVWFTLHAGTRLRNTAGKTHL